MSGSPVSEFASAILVGTCGRLLFQLRDDRPDIAYPGWLGIFGGHREGSESFAECVSREVHEEIGHLVPPERFEPLGDYSGTTQDGRRIAGRFFMASAIPVGTLVVTEGALVMVERGEVPAVLSRLEPSARAATRLFLDRDPAH